MDDGAASPFGWEIKCCTRRRDLFHRDYKQGEGADGSCCNQDERREGEYREKERKMKVLLNGTNHRREVIRAVGNHYNDNTV